MNFTVVFIGLKKEPFDTCVKWFIHTAMESDYRIETVSWHKKTPVSPYEVSVKLIGSSKSAYLPVLVDFDNIAESDTIDTVISPITLEMEYTSSGLHYWGALGALFKIITDISPAYVTGFLLQKKLDAEMKMFKQFTSQLPFTMQLQLQETYRDVEQPQQA